MVVIIDIKVDAADFRLGRLFESFSDIAVEVERVIPTNKGVMPLFWILGADPHAVVESLKSDTVVKSVQVLTRADERTLIEVTWNPDIDRFLEPLMDNDGDVLRADGGAETWEFRIQFRDRDALRAFRDDCEEHKVTTELVRLYNPNPPESPQVISDEQRDALLTAFETGYWKIPRESHLEDMADRIGISDQAISERLRRGCSSLVEAYVIPEQDADGVDSP
jgi:predicted DNA binding protein